MRTDGTAVLAAVVNCVTIGSPSPSVLRSAPGTGGGIRDIGEDFGGRGDYTTRSGLEDFDHDESEALSSVCVEALRALVRPNCRSS